MPELKNQDMSDFKMIENLDFNSIPYKDKYRETARKKKLEHFKETGELLVDYIFPRTDFLMLI